MLLNFNSVCRICLEEGMLKPIFTTTRTFESLKVSCTEMILACATVAADKNDGLPSNICTKCISKLKAAYAFRKQCEQSYNILLRYTISDEKPSIKVEKAEVPVTVECDIPSFKLEEIELKIEKPDVEDDESKDFDNIVEAFTSFQDDDEYYNNNSNNDPSYESMAERKAALRKRKKLKSKEKKEKTASKLHIKRDKTKEILGVDVNNLKDENGHYKCDQCPSIIICKRAFVRHLERHLGIKSFFCDICQKYFAREWVHMQKHLRPREKRFQCDQCDKMFENRGNLNVHLRTHNMEKPFACTDCGKRFQRIDRLQMHSKIHSGIKEYICQYCSKDFYMQKNLQTHIKYRHTKDRQYQCTRCDKRFVTGNCLKIHERRHLGIKTYHCKSCEKSFVSASGLRTHSKMHTKEKPHACRVCSVKFGRTDHRNRHEMTAHGADFRIQKQNIAI